MSYLEWFCVIFVFSMPFIAMIGGYLVPLKKEEVYNVSESN